MELGYGCIARDRIELPHKYIPYIGNRRKYLREFVDI